MLFIQLYVFQRKSKIETIMLVPELCYMSGLTDALRQDFRVMKVRCFVISSLLFI